ncbi:polynucleotide adenylyltransferase PcnB [Moraxella nasovis]|uniref:polynucleotide adenylyltransferase PcnB n=1 Tax=Moraxella nasovis TaxID=2904121 RepID=UPI001F6142B1|nr:polynucleotide adenylyltransferase PcnB [Moraxella nasovis]UNU72526.1 polynucleotide adenylyltransferase PcnB [Moraxella nasovis]
MARTPAKSRKNSKKVSPVIHDAAALGLKRNALPHSIVEVVGTLIKAGFDAYIVGGGVRDSLLGLAPKDFDAVTNARPHEIKAIFGGRCRIIGRRFQLAHVYSGREMIEVATFRAAPKDDTHTTDDGMITRDNVWGTIEEDFIRRDFSINALYYNPIKGEVLDFCGALQDIKQKRLRLLGDAKLRVEEDPVRLLRALRFKAKLGFDFDKTLSKQFHGDNWALLEQVSAHRLYDETQKMFTGGYLTPLLPLLYKYGAMSSLMAYAAQEPSKLSTQVAINSDRRVDEGKTLNPAFFYAVLLWENYLYHLAKFKKKGLPFYEAQLKASAKAVDAQRVKTAIPRFAEEFISQIWIMQAKLVNPRVKQIAVLEKMPKFRAAFDFLVLREQFDDHPLSEPTNGMAAWWQAYQETDELNRERMIDELATGDVPTKRRKKRKTEDKAELHQLQQLSLGEDKPSDKPEPLFVVEGVNELLESHQMPQKPKLRQPEVALPAFEVVAYTEDDFLKLLNNDEPYIPSSRLRKRKPSSSLSVKERESGMTQQVPATSKEPKKSTRQARVPRANKPTAKPNQLAKTKIETKTKTETKTADQKSKPRRKRKPNAKPKATD